MTAQQNSPKYSKQAEKFLGKQNQKTAQRIIIAINKLPDGDVKKLRGFKSLYRLKVGDYRVKFTYDKDNNQIAVEEIDTRGGIYKMGVIL